MRKCRKCMKDISHRSGNAKFCSDDCRKRYWEQHIEPRAVCEDCGTLMGQKSLRNTRRRSSRPLCISCALYARKGTGRDF